MKRDMHRMPHAANCVFLFYEQEHAAQFMFLLVDAGSNDVSWILGRAALLSPGQHHLRRGGGTGGRCKKLHRIDVLEFKGSNSRCNI